MNPVLLLLNLCLSPVVIYGEEIPIHLWSRGPTLPDIDYRCLGSGCSHRPLRNRQITVHRPQAPPRTTPVVVRPPITRRQLDSSDGIPFPYIDTRHQCSTGFCHYVSACQVQATLQPIFCKMDNGFTGICCKQALEPLSPTGNVTSSFPGSFPGHYPGPSPSPLPSRLPNRLPARPVSRLSSAIPSPIPRTRTIASTVPSTRSRTTAVSNRPRSGRLQIPNQIGPGQSFLKSRNDLEDELLRNRIVPQQNSQEFSHQHFFGSSQQTFEESRLALEALQAFMEFARRENLSIQDIISGRFNIRDSSLELYCTPAPNCKEFRYRTIDGTCNNLINRAQGKAISTFARLLPPEYADGINEPKRAADGSELPNARLLSLSIAQETGLENNFYSLLLMQFGQFVDHDISRAAITRTHQDTQITCCDEKILQNPRLLHPACMPIPVPESDSFLRGHSRRCIDFVRTAPARNPRCLFGPREQLNQLSSYLDGNQIYGASDREMRELRMFRGGLLKFSLLRNQPFPPMRSNSTQFNCLIPRSSNRKCFAAGDIRSNEVVDLAVLHTVFLREHNRVATILSQLNPSWNDETLYQEAKRIVVAEFQHIIYNEFLPMILGARTMAHYRLGLRPSGGYSDSYDPIVDPSILNEFSAAAYRLHSLIQGTLHLKTPDDLVVGTVRLRETFSNPSILYDEGVYEMRIAGLTGQPIRAFDNYFSKEITNHLFQAPGKGFGLDLVALNIQRGRDHGLPGYVKYRQVCGLPPVRTFEDLRSFFIEPSVVDVLRQHYRHVEDIDLFIGGTSERPLPGAVVGPTFACIIGEQFRRIKEGDRFWYENGNLDTSFTPDQLRQLKQATMARILCDNSDVGIMQPWVFMMPSASNPKTSCNQLPVVDLSFWKQ